MTSEDVTSASAVRSGRRRRLLFVRAVAGVGLCIMALVAVTFPSEPLPWCGTLVGDGLKVSVYKNGSIASEPNVCVGNIYHQIALENAYFAKLAARSPFFQIPEGVTILSALALFALVTKFPRFPKKRAAGAMKVLFIAATALFAFLAVEDVAFASCFRNPLCYNSPTGSVVSSILDFLDSHLVLVAFPKPPPPDWDTELLTQGGGRIGFFSFLVLGAAALGFAFWKGDAARSILDVAAPATFALMTGLLVFDSGEMYLYAANFAVYASAGGIYLLSNWTALVVSGGLTGWGMVRRMHRPRGK